MFFPTFLCLSLSFVIRGSCSELQSAPGLVFATVQRFSIFSYKEYNQSDFGIDHLVISMCRAVSCVVGRRHLLWPVCSLGTTVSLCPASFCTPRPNLSVTPGVSWLPTLAFQSPMLKRTFWGRFSSRSSCRSSQNHSNSASSALVVGAWTWITVMLNALPWIRTEISLLFLRLHPSTDFWICYVRLIYRK